MAYYAALADTSGRHCPECGTLDDKEAQVASYRRNHWASRNEGRICADWVEVHECSECGHTWEYENANY
jgi:Zn ribbon nucleic-acid-binding protein